MNKFKMNGLIWNIILVDQNDPLLIDRTRKRTVATTDPITRCVYISNRLRGDFFYKVLIHELGHCVMISYDLFDEIHFMVHEEYWVDAEEWVCNFMANYGLLVFKILRNLYGENSIQYVPSEIERSFIA